MQQVETGPAEDGEDGWLLEGSRRINFVNSFTPSQAERLMISGHLPKIVLELGVTPG